jgi:hypothetical protein
MTFENKISGEIEKKLLIIVKSWNINPNPEYRGFRCASCQRKMHKAWHVWLNSDGYKLEVHFCRKCFADLNKV